MASQAARAGPAAGGEEPVVLSDQQLDAVTAGDLLNLNLSLGALNTLNANLSASLGGLNTGLLGSPSQGNSPLLGNTLQGTLGGLLNTVTGLLGILGH
ncbi:MAG TPA: hypothetical protein VE964_03885 [Myxococcales bacterium]|nr:hypothetical protein [Myxococcales bacterium]